MIDARFSVSRWKTRHAVVVWIGIVLNLIFAIPLLVDPNWLFSLIGVPTVTHSIWARFSGVLLIILSAFYVPMTLDLDRYRIFAWLAVFPSRTFGAILFLVAVLGYGQSAGFIIGVLIDGSIAIASLYCLIRISSLEQDIMTGAVRS